MKFNRAFLASLPVLGCLLAAGTAQATTITYTYQGNDFTAVDLPIPGNVIGTTNITTSDAISGSFTVNLALAPNLNNQLISPSAAPYLLSAAFTDGAGDTEPANLKNSLLVVSTDSMSNITSWFIDTYSATGNITLSTCSSTTPSCATIIGGNTPEFSEDLAVVSGTVGGIDALNDGFTYNNPGKWTASVAWTPEPSSFWRLGTGVLILAATHKAWAPHS